MYDVPQLEEKLKNMLSPNRFRHSVGVMETAVEMATIHGADVEKARVAGLMHDVAKEVPKDEVFAYCSRYHVVLDDTLRRNRHLIHGALGAAMLNCDFGILDEEILDAVKYHTIAKPDMTKLAKIIYLADLIEPYRKPHKGFKELRESCMTKDLDTAFLEGLNLSLEYLLRENKRIHYMTVEARNYLISELFK